MAETNGVIADGAKLERLAGEYAFTEGPATDAAGNVFFTDQPNDRILRWDAASGKVTTFLEPAGRSNGTCFDAAGNLWSCADGKNEIWRVAPDGTAEVMVRDFGGKLLNGPNDVWVVPDGGSYWTDPFYARDYWTRGGTEQPVQGVYYLAPGATELVLVEGDLVKPNGIVGTADGRQLYVGDIGASKIYVYDVEVDGTLSNRRFVCERRTDGITLDVAGNLYATGDGVTIYDPAGTLIESIPVPEKWTSNITFAGADRRTLFITASTGIYAIRTTHPGVASAVR